MSKSRYRIYLHGGESLLVALNDEQFSELLDEIAHGNRRPVNLADGTHRVRHWGQPQLPDDPRVWVSPIAITYLVPLPKPE